MGIEFQVDLSGNVAENAKKAADALAGMGSSAKIIKTEIGTLDEKIVRARALGKPFQKLEADLRMAKAAFAGLPPAMQAAANSEERLIEAVKLGEQAMKAADAEAKKLALDSAAMAKESEAAAAAMRQGWIGAAKAVGEAAIAIVTAFAAVVAAGAALAIEAALAHAKLIALFSAMAGGREAGVATVAMLDKLGDELGLTRGRLAETAKAFEAMGITNLDELREKVRAVTAVTAVMGDEGAAAFEKLTAKTQEAIDTGAKFQIKDKQIAQFRQMGISIGDIADRMGMTSKALEQGLTKGTIDAAKFQAALDTVATSKFGDALAEQALEPSNLLAKFKENVSKLFEGVDVKPFLRSVQELVGLFGTDKASGRAMKVGLTATFTEVFSVAKRFVDWLQTALLKTEIAVLRAVLFMKPWVRAFEELDAKYGIIDKLVTGAEILAGALGVVAAIATALVVGPFALLAAAGAVVWLVLGTLEGMVMSVAYALGGMADDAITAAEDFISGLVDGIAGGVDKVIEAAKGVATGAVSAVTGVFQSHSPSVVMRQIGQVGFAGGLALGIQGGVGQVAEASHDVASVAVGTVGAQVGAVAPAQASTAAAAPPPWERVGGGSSSSSSSTSSEQHFHFAPGSLVVQGAGKSAEGITEELVALVFERVAIEQGAI